MAPLEDGSVPAVPWHYTSVVRELTSLKDEDGKQLIFSVVSICSGANEGASHLVFRNTEDGERLAIAIASSPAAWFYHYATVERKYREDCVLSLLRSFDVAARGRAPLTSWDASTWTVIDPNAAIGDSFFDDIAAEGFELSDHHKVITPEISAVVANQDAGNLLTNLGLKVDATCGTRSIGDVSGASHATQGETSIRGQTEVQFHRGLEAQCIANARRMEAEAVARWGSDINSVASGLTRNGQTDSAPSNSPPSGPSTSPSSPTSSC